MKMNSTTTKGQHNDGARVLGQPRIRCVVRLPTLGQLGFKCNALGGDEVFQLHALFMGDVGVAVNKVFDYAQNTRIGEGITYGIK